mmetsp:Transcript_12970/g.18966  ORF Transcript_12970/g.18966 Transcript_12970/m.18966 type:complete len:270 (-) Transcript_12970:453-1262(-)
MRLTLASLASLYICLAPVVIEADSTQPAFVVIPTRRNACNTFQKSILKPKTTTTTTIVRMSSNENEEWKIQGEEIIKKAAMEAGASPDQITISWKPTRVIVTVSGTQDKELVLSAIDDEDDDDDNVILDEEDDYDDDVLEEQEQGDDPKEEKEGLDITSIARAINAALDGEEGSLGWQIAFNHEIEVTTPGISDILEGSVMFEAYRGFDVIMQGVDPKKPGKKKVLEGKLVERDDKFTKVNVKGRVVKMKNEDVEFVKLPKAKREKGVR